jgi:hypothetical protein
MRQRTFWRRTGDRRWLDGDEVFWIVHILAGISAAFWDRCGRYNNCIEGVWRHHHFKDLGPLALTMAEVKRESNISRGTGNMLFERSSYREKSSRYSSYSQMSLSDGLAMARS